MLQTLKNAFLAPDIRKKILFTLAIIFIYRIGCFIPVPGLDPTTFSSGQENDFMQMLYMITGGSLQNGTIFALGIIPFINSFIIMQLLTLVIPKRKIVKGRRGRQKADYAIYKIFGDRAWNNTSYRRYVQLEKLYRTRIRRR